jgi:hypothetical protein
MFQMKKVFVLVFISISFLSLKMYAQNDSVDTTGIFTGTPDSLPYFQNSQQDWLRFLQKNLKVTVPANNGAPAGKYQPVISFIVNEDGSLSDIQIEKDDKFKSGEEALRVMKLRQSWYPAIYQGKPVKYRFHQKFIFVVTEN